MTSIINPLSEDLRNKISAGEVVERPASVVKELLENSLDAGSKFITVAIEKGGHQTIQVTDSGQGISRSDLVPAFQRYSTSKIQNLDDLFSIQTLGFRGEALSSIASVAEIQAISSTKDSQEGYSLAIIDGIPGNIEPAPDVQGTQITIKNLFYNTPARRKFLKSPKIELRQILQTIRRIALAYPEVHFVLNSDGKEIINLSPQSIEDRIAGLFDTTYRKNLLPFNIKKGDFHFKGFVGNLNLVRSRPGEQFLFLNRRFIKDRLLNSSIYSGYKSLTNRGEFPFFLIELSVPVDQVDVNVHPMKTEVRFRDEWRIYHVLQSGVHDALSSILDTAPALNYLSPKFQFTKGSYSSGQTAQNKENPDQSSMYFKPVPDNMVHRQQSITGLERAKSYASSLATRENSSPVIDIENIWQIHNKYILSQIKSGLVIIDQHVAHERILFEQAMAAFDKKPITAQTLLFPETLDFSPDEFSVIMDILPFLEKIGFRLKKSKRNSLLVEAIPSEMGWGNEKQVIRDIIDYYISHQKKYSSYQENLAASFACHTAIKAGDKLNPEEMKELVNRLFGTKHPYFCPHGRPIIIQLSLDELDKRFERI